MINPTRECFRELSFLEIKTANREVASCVDEVISQLTDRIQLNKKS